MAGSWTKLTWAALAAIGMAVAAAPGALAEVRPPLGLQLHCLQNAADCRGGHAEKLVLSTTAMRQLRQINHRINATITPRNDRGLDIWQADARAGDCEDYVMAKREHLIAAGIPRGALRIAYTRTSAGQGHAVLVVRTDRGDVVLDNLNPEVLSVAASGYRIETMSSANILEWTSYR